MEPVADERFLPLSRNAAVTLKPISSDYLHSARSPPQRPPAGRAAPQQVPGVRVYLEFLSESAALTGSSQIVAPKFT